MSDHSDSHAQPKPTGDGNPVTVALIEDLLARRKQGMEKYGTELKAFNGRDALVDAYQEVLDLANYIKQELMERDAQVFSNFTTREYELMKKGVERWHNALAALRDNGGNAIHRLHLTQATDETELAALFYKLEDWA